MQIARSANDYQFIHLQIEMAILRRVQEFRVLPLFVPGETMRARNIVAALP